MDRHQATKQGNIQDLQNAYQSLLQQEEDLLVAIGRTKNAQENAWRRWITGPWRQYDPPDAAEANLPVLEGRLQNVRDEKQRVRDWRERSGSRGEVLGNNRQPSHESRLELGLDLSRRFSGTNNLDCGRASQRRKTFHSAGG